MLVVLKFGGTSVANVPRILHAAQLVIDKYVRDGNQVAVVTSAMAGVTDQLNGYLTQMDALTEEDGVVLAAGEQVTTALMAIALTKLGHVAQSFLGWQVPITTSAQARNAHIVQVNAERIKDCLDAGIIPVVAGFQGLTDDGRITTLGRGGSDTTAVAIATALDADFCDIYTDVDGVYTADPCIVPTARKIYEISYEEMYELSSSGAKILQARSVELAMRHNVQLRVLSAFVDLPGTSVANKQIEMGAQMERLKITGIAHKHNVAKVDIEAMSMDVLLTLLENAIPFELLAQYGHDGATHIALLVEMLYADKVESLCNELKSAKQISDGVVDRNVAAVSIVGAGIDATAIQSIIRICHENNIPVMSLSISNLKISFVTTKPNLELAIFALHTALFPLEEKGYRVPD
ncbi:MAG: aspartate kinase [Holosporales bacterium]|nr:aspartate kinase [Holosporales bacterium]